MNRNVQKYLIVTIYVMVIQLGCTCDFEFHFRGTVRIEKSGMLIKDAKTWAIRSDMP